MLYDNQIKYGHMILNILGDAGQIFVQTTVEFTGSRQTVLFGKT